MLRPTVLVLGQKSLLSILEEKEEDTVHGIILSIGHGSTFEYAPLPPSTGEEDGVKQDEDVEEAPI